MNTHRRGITRRDLLLGAAVGTPLALLAGCGRSPDAASPKPTPSPLPVSPPQATASGMPGRYPGRVIEVHDPHAVSDDYAIDADAVKGMVGQGMRDLVGCDHPAEAWRSFFQRGDVVGIKINPVGRKPKPGEWGRVPTAHGAISSPELLLEVVSGLRSAGVPPRDIIVFERYADEFAEAGYLDLMNTRPMDGVRWFASSAAYSDTQLDVRGFDQGRDNCPSNLVRHVAGYDPDVFVHMGFCAEAHDPKDERRFYSHLSLIVTRFVNKLITLPVLKDHRSAGVTLALKNLSHGMNNNVARSHLGIHGHGGDAGPEQLSGPNQCNTFIPTAVAQRPTMEKATLHILDGLVGVYEGGPGCWNKTWGTWRRGSLFFATDPVALDMVGWDIIDAERAKHGLLPVGRTGLANRTPANVASTHTGPLAATDPVSAVALAGAGQNRLDGWASETFDLRQPEHVLLAGRLGLGAFDLRAIDHRCREMRG